MKYYSRDRFQTGPYFSSNKVIFETSFSDKEYLETPLNAALFSWVIENLCKNATDAIGDKGRVILHAVETDNHVIIDVEDTGKGINKSKFKTYNREI